MVYAAVGRAAYNRFFVANFPHHVNGICRDIHAFPLFSGCFLWLSGYKLRLQRWPSPQYGRANPFTS
jgi:hypothetical protein